MVAFATHGLIAGEFGLQEPALALTPPQDARAPSDEGYVDDGLLTASEVMSLSLTAEWVILSACNTAAAGAQSAEGMSGLARAFFYAGAEALLVSHWRMRDDVAMRLSTRAVALSQGSGRTRAQALRAAMSEVMRDPRDDSAGHSLSHPGAWAAFQFVGAPS